MKRRGFLAGLGIFGALPLPALASKPKGGFVWKTVCPNAECNKELSQFIDMTGPLKVGNQCPGCLWVMDTTTLAEQIRAYNGQDKYWRKL